MVWCVGNRGVGITQGTGVHVVDPREGLQAGAPAVPAEMGRGGQSWREHEGGPGHGHLQA